MWIAEAHTGRQKCCRGKRGDCTLAVEDGTAEAGTEPVVCSWSRRVPLRIPGFFQVIEGETQKT